MYCSECGAKNKKDALFCEECGAKLEPIEEEKTKKKSTPKKKSTKKLTKKQTIIIIVIVAVIVILFTIFQVLKSITSPQKIVENYIEAINTKDYAKLYDYANYSGDKTFISEKIYTEAAKEKLENSSTINNFTVGTTTYENGGLTAVVTVNTAMKTGIHTTDATYEIRLTKEKEKQFLFFPKWTMNEDELLDMNTLEDFDLIVPKDTEITYGGVKVTEKYKNKEEKDEDTVTYTLPQVITATTKVEYKLPGGLEVEKEVTPSTYNTSFSLNILASDISKKSQTKLTNIIKNTTEAMMKGIIDNKDFKDIKSNFAKEEDSEYYQDLEDEYADYKKDIEEEDSELTKFNIEDIEIYSIGFTRSYELSVRVRVSYNWTEKDKETNKTEENDNYSYYTYYMVPEENEYKVVGISSFPTTVSWLW